MQATATLSKNTEKIYQCLDRIIKRDQCALSYDRTLVEELPDILRENYGIRTGEQIREHDEVAELAELLNHSESSGPALDDLPDLIAGAGIDVQRYSTRVKEDNGSEFTNFSTVSHEEDVDAVLTLQRDLGQGKHKAGDQPYDPHLVDPRRVRRYLRGVTTPPPTFIERLFKTTFWAIQIRKWKLLGWIKGDQPSLSVGGRWLSEIHYFREVHGLRHHIGLDLHSADENLVKVGDMHDMPFSENQFGFVFIKNTVDKSYDVRKLVSELIRVSRHNGIIVVDQVCDYGSTSTLGRTDIQRAENLLRIFQARTGLKKLVCQDVDIQGVGDVKQTNGSKNNARLAIKVLKS